MNKHIKRYLADCKKIFPFFGCKEKDFFKKFQNNIIVLTENCDTITYQELVQTVGSPKDIMISYVNDCEDNYIIDKINYKVMIKRIFITITIILITGLSIICYYEWKTIEESRHQKIITEEIEIDQNLN